MAFGVVPAEHAKVTGRPVTAGDTDSTQDEERTTEAVSVVVPPAEVRPFGAAAKPVTAGLAPCTVAVRGVDVIVPPGPVTVILKVYVLAVADVFAGTVIFLD